MPRGFNFNLGSGITDLSKKERLFRPGALLKFHWKRGDSEERTVKAGRGGQGSPLVVEGAGGVEKSPASSFHLNFEP